MLFVVLLNFPPYFVNQKQVSEVTLMKDVKTGRMRGNDILFLKRLN